ncbi:MAG TPA: hypothetical protein DCZ20_03860, partial [Lachnospiraceae bacterium]|nr:hypothetical protein [Lachnospiraceae bacterium]
KALIEEHVAATGSPKGKEVLEHFRELLPKFKKIIPNDYKRMIRLMAHFEKMGDTPDQAGLEAFYESTRTKE